MENNMSHDLPERDWKKLRALNEERVLFPEYDLSELL